MFTVQRSTEKYRHREDEVHGDSKRSTGRRIAVFDRKKSFCIYRYRGTGGDRATYARTWYGRMLEEDIHSTYATEEEDRWGEGAIYRYEDVQNEASRDIYEEASTGRVRQEPAREKADEGAMSIVKRS